MKKIILIIIVCTISTNLFSQTYKLETISGYASSEILSHLKPLESTNNIQMDTFSLWKEHKYSDYSGSYYEVEYYKGNVFVFKSYY